MNGNKRASTPWVDPEDAPDLGDVDMSQAVWRVGDKNVSLEQGQSAMAKASRRGRPKAIQTKEPVKLRLDADVLSALRATGDGWQTRINDTLRASLALSRQL
jgi:uncharacterized protein (DUF4415 family)